MAAYLKKPFSHNPLIARKPLIRVIIPELESSDLSARRCWATAQPTDSGTRRLGRGPTPPPWVKVARQVGTLWPWYHLSVKHSRAMGEGAGWSGHQRQKLALDVTLARHQT